MKFTLQLKAALLSTALVVGLLATVGVVQDGDVGQNQRELLRTQQDALAESVADGLADKLETRRQVLEHAATALAAIELGDPGARERFLRQVLASPALFDGVAIIGLDGEVLTNDPPLPAGRRLNVRDRGYFQQVLATGGSSLSAPLESRAGSGAVVLMAAPARDAQGRIVAVVAGGLQLHRANLFGQLAQAPVGRTGHFEIVTLGGAPTYVAHPDPARLLTAAPPPGEPNDDIVTHKNIRGTDWELRVVLPGWEAAAPAALAQRKLLGRLALLGAVAALLAWLATRWLFEPIGRLHASIVALRADPGAPVRLDTGARNELGDLAREFTALVDDVRSREAEVDAVIQASPFGFFRADVDGNITFANDAYLRKHGLAREQMRRGWLQLVRPEIRASSWEAWTQAMRRPEPLAAVRRMTRPDGSVALLSLRSAPLVVDGRLRGHVGAVQDITARAEAERALRELATIFDSTTDFVVQTDRHGTVTYLNPAARRACGFAADAPLHGLSFAEFNTPQTNALYASTILPAVRRDGVWLGRSTVCVQGRRELPVSHMVIAHRDRDGRIDRFSAVMRDISAELSVQEQEQRHAATLRSVTEALPAIVAVVGADGRYRFVNTAFERWCGKPREQIVGCTLEQVLGAEDAARSRPWVERALAGETIGFEREYTGSAHVQHLALTYIPLRLDDGRVDGFVGVGHDVTGHRREQGRLLALSHRDALTGLSNRAGFEHELAQCLANGEGAGVALLYIDLDRFKDVNDTHGHPVGDELLRLFGERLRTIVRPSDRVARLGGDEFTVLLRGVRTAGDAARAADKVVAAAATPFQVGTLTLHIGASVGVAFGASPGTGPAELVRRADTNLYRAKHAGRGRSVASASVH